MLDRSVFCHGPPQAQRTHVGPHALDMVETLLLEAGNADRVPAVWWRPFRRPDRVLLLIVDDHGVGCGVLIFIEHWAVPPWSQAKFRRLKRGPAWCSPAARERRCPR